MNSHPFLTTELNRLLCTPNTLPPRAKHLVGLPSELEADLAQASLLLLARIKQLFHHPVRSLWYALVVMTL
jgi:hypothetical protein